MKKIIVCLYFISGSLLTSLLWMLQEIKEKLSDDCVFVKHGLLIGIASSALVLIIGLYYSYLYYNSDKIILEKWSHMLLKHILQQYLANDNYRTRLTIFRPKIGWKTWWTYIRRVLFGIFSYNIKRGRFKLAFRNFPIHPRTIYLQQTDRVASTKNPGSMTIFRTSVRGDSYNGIADKCFREDKDKLFATSNALNNVDIPTKYPNVTDANYRNIRAYMEAMFIGKEYYDVFRGMNFRTKQVLAFPLRKSDDNVWGIIVIDTDDDFEQSLDDILKDHIGDYQIMFRSMCESLK